MLMLSLILAVDLRLRPAPPAGGIAPADVLFELNRARTGPAGLARLLAAERPFYRGDLVVRPGAAAAELTREGVAPLDEAIAFTDAHAAEAPLAAAPVLAAAAADHQADQGSTGLVGHQGLDGSRPADRVRQHGGGGLVGELIAYGAEDAAGVVRQLVVDDGVADRGHRRLLFDPSLRFAGVACGPHPVYRTMCVVTLGRTPDGRPLAALRGGTGLAS